MPRRPLTASLRLLAIRAVGKHLELICFGCRNISQVNAVIESEAYLKVPGPFTTWPASLLEEMLKELCSRRCSAYHLHLLIQPQVRRLQVQSGTVHHALHFSQLRCAGLQCIEIKSERDIIPELFIRVFSAFPRLVRIDLSGTCIDDRAFNTIGSTCKLLRLLELSNSTVSDTGLRFLSLGPGEERRCQSLTTLGLRSARVSRKGVAAMLHYHPKLTDLQYEDTIGALAELEAMGCDPWSGIIKILSCGDSRDIGGDLESALEQNPNFESLELANTTLRTECLYPVMQCGGLRSLHLGNTDSFLLDWGEGVAPLLSACGRNLRTLRLDRFCYVDTSLIGRLCPVLQELALSHIVNFAPVMQLGERVFRDLEDLTVINSYGTHIMSTVIKQLLLHSTKLQELHLKLVDSLDDPLWSQVLSVNGLNQLVSVTLDQCHGISDCTLHSLVIGRNLLETLNIWSCRFITEREKNCSKQIIKLENMDVTFRCLAFQGFQALPLPPMDLPPAGEIVPLINLD